MPNTDPAAGARLARGALSGLIGGLMASFAMERFQAVYAGVAPTGDDGGEPATRKAADRVSRAVTGRRIPQARRQASGEAVHYLVGALVGAAYGALAEFRPQVTAGAGAPLGAAASLVIDEALVPATGLGRPFWKAPAASHAYSLVSHLVFGVVTEVVRRQVRLQLKSE